MVHAEVFSFTDWDVGEILGSHRPAGARTAGVEYFILEAFFKEKISLGALHPFQIDLGRRLWGPTIA